MSKLKLNITMSLDGFVAGPDQSARESDRYPRPGAPWLAASAQGVPREARGGGRRGQRQHAVCRGHPRRRRRDHHGPKHVRGWSGIVGRVMAGLVGRRSTLSSSRVRPHEPSARVARASRRNDVPFRHGRDRIGARTGTGSSRREGGLTGGWGVGGAAIPRRGSPRRDRRLDRSGPARRRRSAVRTSRGCEARAGRVGRGARCDPHPICPGVARRSGKRQLFGVVARDPPGAELLELQAVDQERLAGPEARRARGRCATGAARSRGASGRRRARSPRPRGTTPRGRSRARSGTARRAGCGRGCSARRRRRVKTSTPQHSFGASSAACACSSARIAAGTTTRASLSIDSSTSSALQKSPERYFQPPSASTATTTEPSGSSLGDAARDVDDRAGRDAGEDPLAVEQRVHRGDRLGVRDEELPVELRDVEDRRHVAVLERAQAHHRVAGQRLGGGDDDVRERLAHARARCPSASRRCRGRRRARRRAAGRARSRRRCPRSGRAGSTRSRTGRASCSADPRRPSPAPAAPRRSSPRSRASRRSSAPKSSSTSRRSGVAFAGITHVSL